MKHSVRRSTLVFLCLALVFTLFIVFSEKARLWTLGQWELLTGQYIISIVSTESPIIEVRVPKSQSLLQDIDRLNERTARAKELIKQKEEERRSAEADQSTFQDAWSESVRGYLLVSTQECPVWEDCKSVTRADFVILGAASSRLSAYLGKSADGSTNVPIGCLEESHIRTLPILEIRTKGYKFIRGESFQILKSSNREHPVLLTFEKPLYASEFGTEGLTCMTPFINFVVSKENENIRVTTPETGAVIESPLVVRGEARGNWYFEASFPIRLLDGNGKEVSRVVAEAKADWMTTDFVPFEATLTFPSMTTPTGTLVLEKDNPSGLPENAAELQIPIRFTPGS